MSYSVICPSCNEKNSGSAFQCVKCHTDLIGIPRQDDSLSDNITASQQKTTTNGQAVLSEDDKYLVVESVPHALWRTFRSSLVILLIVLLLTAFVCWSRNMRTLYEFGNALFYSGTVLAFIGWFIFKGNQQLVRSQINPLNPMNKVMPGAHSEQARRNWLDHMEGMTSVSVIGVAVALCFGLAILIVNLAS